MLGICINTVAKSSRRMVGNIQSDEKCSHLQLDEHLLFVPLRSHASLYTSLLPLWQQTSSSATTLRHPFSTETFLTSHSCFSGHVSQLRGFSCRKGNKGTRRIIRRLLFPPPGTQARTHTVRPPIRPLLARFSSM